MTAAPRIGGIEARRAAILELLRKRTPEARQQLEEIASTDPSPPVRYLARKGLEFLERGSQSVTESRDKPPPPSAIRDLLTSRDPLEVRRGIVHAVQSGDPEASELLHEILSFEVNEVLRSEALRYFVEHARPRDHAKLVTLLRDSSPLVRRRLPPALLKSDEDKSIPYLLYMLQDPDPDSRREARALLGTRSRQLITSHLESMIGAKEVWMRDSAAYAASRLGDPSLMPVLVRGSRDSLELIRMKAAKGLAELAGKGVEAAAQRLVEMKREEESASARPAAPAADPAPPRPSPAPRAPPPAEASADERPLVSAMDQPGGLGDPNPRVRLRALETAVRRDEKERLPEILTRLDLEENAHVVAKMLIAIGHLGEPRHLPHLLPHLSDGDTRVVASAIEAMTQLGTTEARARVRPMLKHKDSRIRANVLLYLKDDPAVDLMAELRSMLSGKEYRHKLSALWVLSRLESPELWNLVEIVLGDINDEVREKAFDLLEKWSSEGNEDASAMLRMCLDGEVAIKQESLFLRGASPVRRMLAFMIDALIVGGACLAGVFVAGVMPEPLNQAVIFITLAIGSGVFFIRDAHNDGRGFGKKMMGLRTVDLASNRGCTRAQSLLRQGFLGLGLAGPVELVLLHTDAGGRRMGDWMVNTQVIEEVEAPVSATEVFVAGCGYLPLILAFVGAIAQLFVPPETDHADIASGYRMKLPSGWEFEGRRTSVVSFKRRSLMRGEEISGQVSASSRATETGGETPEEPSLEARSAEIQKEVGDFLKALDENVEIVGRPTTKPVRVSGKSAVRCDIVFKVRGNEGMVSTLRLATDRTKIDMRLIAPDRATFDARKEEVEQLVSGVELVAP